MKLCSEDQSWPFLVATRLDTKLRRLKNCTDEISVSIYPLKSRFITINADDTSNFILDKIIISHTRKYIYRGQPLFNDIMSVQMKEHKAMKNNQVMKFASFLAKTRMLRFK